MIKLCKENECTGCGLCSFVCPRHCISLKENNSGILLPYIQYDKCIECGACQKKCPQLNPVSLYKPIKAYAAWSCDISERLTSASGGIAAELYKYALRNNMIFAGARINDDFSVSVDLGKTRKDIDEFKNSKYVFSSICNLFESIQCTLKEKGNIIIIGLPCQIAALRKFLGKQEKIFFIDVVCHGTTPYRYLKEHIEQIEKMAGDKAEKMSFRDPDTDTDTFTFTLYNKSGVRFYAKRTADGDSYQYGYHRKISYRENCYHCRYAQMDRTSDITLGDYKGLGTQAPCSFDEKNVSCILVNTRKGEMLINKLIADDKIFAEERPLMEPINSDTQLQHPSEKGRARNNFEYYIKKYNGNFEQTMKKVMRLDLLRHKLKEILHYN